MTKNLPYLSTPGTIVTALNRIRNAATPERVTPDFVSTILLMKGGSGGQVIPFLKKINFVASDGTPTDLYKNFRNATISGQAVFEGIKFGYASLLEANEYFYRLAEKELTALIVQVTGLDVKNQIVRLIFSTINSLKSFIDFDKITSNSSKENQDKNNIQSALNEKKELKTDYSKKVNLSYTINLNLPATTDQAVFNAIFKSLREHLLSDDEE